MLHLKISKNAIWPFGVGSHFLIGVKLIICVACKVRPARGQKKPGPNPMCSACQAQKLRGSRPGFVRPVCKGKICTFDNCEDPQYADQLCNTHWQRKRAGKDLNRERNRRGFDNDSPSYHLIERICRNCSGAARWSDICERCRSLEKDRKRRALKNLENLSEVELKEISWWETILRKDPCSYCLNSSDTVDHVVAIHNGGSFRTDNLGGSCKSCNSSKADQDLLQFMLNRLEKL